MAVLVVANDTGGAELVSLFVKSMKLDCKFLLDGPAKLVFQSNLKITELPILDNIPIDYDYLLSGLSWSSKLELRCIKHANYLRKKSFVFLDHWNFSNHDFMLEGTMVLPTALVTADEFAYNRAVELFPNTAVILLENQYLEYISLRIKYLNTTIEAKRQILFLSEPMDNHIAKLIESNQVVERNTYTEIEGFKYFIANIKNITLDIEKVVIRPHPSQQGQKFTEQYLCQMDNIFLSENEELLIDILESEIVVGFQTMAMVVALHAGRRVISAIPPNCGNCILPYPGIEMLRNLID